MSEKKQYLIASSTNEWYTPPVYIDAVRAVLGSIQFDPFSCEVANTLVGADDYYTAADDATMTPWPVVQTVFANPPYEYWLTSPPMRAGSRWRSGRAMPYVSRQSAYASSRATE